MPISQSQFDQVVQKLIVDHNLEGDDINLRNENEDNEEVDEVENELHTHDDLSENDEEIERLVQERMNDPNCVKQCIFCNVVSDGLESNIVHMKSEHYFNIPLSDYAKDIQGLIKHLSIKVYIAHICILCDYSEFGGRIFKSISATQSHMRDLSHCRINLMDNVEEYDKFYDFEAYNKKMQNKILLEKNEDIELLLPSNKIIVHRELSLLYKKPSRETKIDEEELEQEKQLVLEKKN